MILFFLVASPGLIRVLPPPGRERQTSAATETITRTYGREAVS